jgi:hypothetical protein
MAVLPGSLNGRHRPVVGDEPLQEADGDRSFARKSPRAGPFTLHTLIADPAADIREDTRLLQDLVRFFKIPFSYGGDEAGDVVVRWAPFHTGRIRTIQTPVRLE